MKQQSKPGSEGASACQLDLCRLAVGAYPGVADGRRADAAKRIVSLHQGAAEPEQVPWREVAKRVLDALVVPGILGERPPACSLFLVELGKPRRDSLGFACEADYYKDVIERVLDKAAASTGAQVMTGLGSSSRGKPLPEVRDTEKLATAAGL